MLHLRIRIARCKQVTMYRRNVSGAVLKGGGRGFSYQKNQCDRGTAEVFQVAQASVTKKVGMHAARTEAGLN